LLFVDLGFTAEVAADDYIHGFSYILADNISASADETSKKLYALIVKHL